MHQMGDIKMQQYDLTFGRQTWPNIRAVGGFARREAVRAALGRDPGRDGTTEVEGLPVTLVPEPDNPHDSKAISVRWNGRVISYLSREDARTFGPSVGRVVASGYEPVTVARIYAYKDAQGRLQPSVDVHLPDPAMAAPLNDPPTGIHTLIPWGNALQVLKEEDHFDVLFNHVPPSGEGLLLVTLHSAIRTLKNGTVRPFVEVRVDGERVGEMSSTTSAHYLPLLEHTEAIGETATAYAKITGSALAAQLVLHAAKATEISDEWLSSSPHAAPRLVPIAPRYDLPPAYVPEAAPRRNTSTTRTSPPMAGQRSQAASRPGQKSGCGSAALIVFLVIVGLPLLATPAAPMGAVMALAGGILLLRRGERGRNKPTNAGEEPSEAPEGD